MKYKIILVILVLLILPMVYSLMSKGYDESNLQGEFYPVEEVEFLYDLSYEVNGEIKREQTIFNEQLKMIEEAEKFILVDLFLYNDEYDRDKMSFEPQVQQMTEALIKKKEGNPTLEIVFITDELNNFYGAYTQKYIQELMDHGIDVTITDPNMVRDSNPIYSGIYKFYLKWFGVPEGGGIKNIFDPQGPKVNVRSFLKLLNFKANHRKVMVTEKAVLVSSSNPHDPSSLHSNVAVKFYGKPMEDLIRSELGLVASSHPLIENFKAKEAGPSQTQIRVLTEQRIYEGLRDNLKRAKRGDEVKIGIFYIADRKLLKDIADASKRGADIRIIADLNKDAFGLEKNGLPNRPALSELKDENPDIQVRWYQTHGEQFHSKFAYFNYRNEDPRVILGSANFTRRNLQNYNLETDVELIIPRDSELHGKFEDYYSRLWENRGGNYTASLEEFYESGIFHRVLWKFQENTGLCTW